MEELGIFKCMRANWDRCKFTLFFLFYCCVFLLTFGRYLNQKATASVEYSNNIKVSKSIKQPQVCTREIFPSSEKVSFYHLRFEYSTTSDWAHLSLLNSSDILAVKVKVVHGKDSQVKTDKIHPERLILEQSLNEAMNGKTVGVTVDYAIDSSYNQPLKFILQKGSLNNSKLRIFTVSSNNVKLVKEVSHETIVQDDSGRNNLEFSLNIIGLEGISPQQAEVKKVIPQKIIWAFYYPWYDALEKWETIVKDHPLKTYLSNNSDLIQLHIKQAQDAGINGFISSWWGPNSYTDQNLKTILDLSQKKNFRVAIYFETLQNGIPRKSEEIYDWLAYAIKTYRSHPAYMKVDGKPLIVIWASSNLPLSTWKSIFSKLQSEGLDATYLAMGYNPANLDIFDGFHSYSVLTYSNLNQTFAVASRNARYYSLLTDHPASKIWAATVQPGYDERLIPERRRGFFKDRKNGSLYRATWDAALKSDPDWIFITSWNEWYENTHIEPSKSYNDEYIRINREFARKWKRFHHC